MPKEYIEREAIKSKAYPFPCAIGVEYAVPLRAINEEPTADVVEVVRCGECRYFHEYNVLGTKNPSGWGKCKKISMDIDITINDFCSYGAKMDKE